MYLDLYESSFWYARDKICHFIIVLCSFPVVLVLCCSFLPSYELLELVLGFHLDVFYHIYECISLYSFHSSCCVHYNTRSSYSCLLVSPFGRFEWSVETVLICSLWCACWVCGELPTSPGILDNNWHCRSSSSMLRSTLPHETSIFRKRVGLSHWLMALPSFYFCLIGVFFPFKTYSFKFYWCLQKNRRWKNKRMENSKGPLKAYSGKRLDLV